MWNHTEAKTNRKAVISRLYLLKRIQEKKRKQIVDSHNVKLILEQEIMQMLRNLAKKVNIIRFQGLSAQIRKLTYLVLHTTDQTMD